MASKNDPLRDPQPLINSVYAYAAYRLGDSVAAQDVTNDTFERALRYRKTFDRSKGTPTAWLIGIARRVIADRAAETPLVLGLEDDDRVDSVDVEGSSVLRLDLQSALNLLPQRDRELISLRYGSDLTASQIASLLGSDTHAVEVALSRAVAKLRSFIGEMQRM